MDHVLKMFTDLRIDTHNANGLKSTVHKLTNVLQFADEHQVDIMTITNINLTESEGKFAIHQYYANHFAIQWASKDSNKMKGLGLARIISKKWAVHYWSKTVFSP